MSVTDKLLRLHRVDQQVRGLRKRIDGAERYLTQQEQQLTAIETKIEGIRGQIRQLEASAHNNEVEMNALDERVAKLRGQMNSAKTNKEYSALLTEVNTLKADRGQYETAALESMSQIDELKAEMEQLQSDHAERGKMREVARSERDARAAEVKDRLDELEAERAQAAAEVPSDALRVFEEVAEFDDEHAMAPVEEHSRRHVEYACGACQVLLPMEIVSTLLGRGDLTRCVSCGAILYMEESLRESMLAAKK